MAAKHIIIGLIVLILLGGVFTALYLLAGGLGNNAAASILSFLA